MTHNLSALVPAHRAIVERLREMFPDASDDDLVDTVAGESDLPDAIAATLRIALEREATAKALGELIDAMAARRVRIDGGALALRAVALDAMLEAGVTLPLRAPDMSVTIGAAQPKVIITAPDLVPDDLCRIVRAPIKSAIATAIKSGRDVPGATLGNPQPNLRIYRS